MSEVRQTLPCAEGKALSAAQPYLLLVLGKYPGSSSLLCRVCEVQVPDCQFPVCPRKESRGAALGSETFLVSVSAPQILPCHCHSLAAVVGKPSFRDS